jgi:hypothetical protein
VILTSLALAGAVAAILTAVVLSPIAASSYIVVGLLVALGFGRAAAAND